MKFLKFFLLPIILPISSAIIKGISWFGFETEYENLMCTWTHDISWHIKKINEIGFNAIRLPFSYDYVSENNWIHMDKFFDEVQKYNISVTLDFHRIDKTHQASKPYDDRVSFDMFLSTWRTILKRYENINNLENIDVFNEYQSDNYVEWNNLARQIVNYIEKEFPNRFNFFIGGIVWGTNLHFVDLSDLHFSNRIFYTIHTYWFNSKEPMEQWWDYKFGPYKNIVNVGEFGYISTNQNEVEWVERFVKWLVKNNIHDSFFWTYSYNSFDTGGILLEDCETIDKNKINLLNVLWAD